MDYSAAILKLIIVSSKKLLKKMKRSSIVAHVISTIDDKGLSRIVRGKRIIKLQI